MKILLIVGLIIWFVIAVLLLIAKYSAAYQYRKAMRDLDEGKDE